MLTTRNPLTTSTAQDIMHRHVTTIPHDMPLPNAARVLIGEAITAAPVVDKSGGCIGILSAADLIRWATEAGTENETGLMPVCPYQTKGRLVDGQEAVICTLPHGCCPLQDIKPTTAGRHTAVCRQPYGVLCDWQQPTEKVLSGKVCHFMTAEVATALPTASVAELARQVLDDKVHRIFIVDEEHRPIGTVSSTDILAALATDATR